MKKEEVEQMRREFSRQSLSKKEVHENPFKQFEKWFAEAMSLMVKDANAMTLATVDAQNKPHARIVLLKGFADDGFVFYTNYNSDKGKELAENPHAALCFFWPELERQVRIEGGVERISREESEHYFKNRPHKSQLGAIASQQSSVVESRAELEDQFNKYNEMYEEGKVPMPEWWGGFKLSPTSIEFWQGRESRFHDRIKYIKERSNSWKVIRLSP